MVGLNINVQAESEDSLNKILNHIIKEITIGPKYKDFNIENNLKTKDEWVIINSKQINGKYNWRKTNE
jgi:hypothetical protein